MIDDKNCKSTDERSRPFLLVSSLKRGTKDSREDLETHSTIFRDLLYFFSFSPWKKRGPCNALERTASFVVKAIKTTVYPTTSIDQSAPDQIHNLFDDWSIDVTENNLLTYFNVR